MPPNQLDHVRDQSLERCSFVTMDLVAYRQQPDGG